MRQGPGRFVIVLHGHMPWVLHHGRWPHGEHWLLEAVTGVYLPLLGVIDELAGHGVPAGLTLGLTPVLLEQLRQPALMALVDAYLDDRLQRARADQGDPSTARVAAHWERELLTLRDRWLAIDRDLVGAFAGHARAGRIELLSGFAAHGYAALTRHDRCIAAQLRVGLATSERHLGLRPSGIWLPECSFRPTGPWTPPLPGFGGEVLRPGVDRILEDNGVTHFVVDSHLFASARSEGVVEGGDPAAGFQKVGWEAANLEGHRGWRSVLEPHRVGTHGGPSNLVAFARHPDVSEQVWQADGGYPGDGRYLEFHRRKDGDGHRYWRVTDRKTDLGDKQPYDPGAVPAATFSQAAHFAEIVRGRLRAHRAHTGRPGCVTAPFDAELFGHWWHEGPGFLRDLLLRLHADPDVQVRTAAQVLREDPPDKVVWLPEGSWGAGGDHRVWLNEQTSWMWEALYRAEDRFLGLKWRLGRPGVPAAATERLTEAARALLLVQASDWPFVVRTGGAVDYGIRRFCGHLDDFDVLCNIAEDEAAGRSPSPALLAVRAAALARDPVFPGLQLSAWDGEG
ncbi:MAG: hypothetical protein RL071_1461 [Pseudomonadota bacterium]|jgi:1,4-alpha-glucan branching enzyme